MKSFSPLYWFFKFFGNLLFKLYFRFEKSGSENIPAQGPVIIVPNHASFIDPLLIAAAINRKVGYVIIDMFYYKPLIHWFAGLTYCIPVSEEMTGPGGIKSAIKYLRNGNVLCIFPEGGRSRDGKLMEPKSGTGLLAIITGVPVVPTAIKGTFESYPAHYLFPRPKKIKVIFGEPLKFVLEDGRSKKQQGEEITKVIMERIAQMLKKD
ncbi:MAG: 1-acyl-sn-glycerol-3-phosphate acyltransferase [Candidatus Schekmanbacteria bacterium]|nr:1-acyl-sn-glycerol-3-phosphate acyltransferase [Candidatus Schekmanbacteria bacterium]